MIENAYVISPSDVQTPEIECDDCTLNYSLEDYKVLYKAKKLLYFYVPSHESMGHEDFSFDVILCHGCLFKFIKKISEETNDKITFYIVEEGIKKKCSFFPTEVEESQSKEIENMDELDEFLGNDLEEEDDDWDDDDYDFLDPPKD
tara:strand:+ start:173 stop:610 length:438 start_codon:yes stop_codon:yes gene_type:complete